MQYKTFLVLNSYLLLTTTKNNESILKCIKKEIFTEVKDLTAKILTLIG